MFTMREKNNENMISNIYKKRLAPPKTDSKLESGLRIKYINLII